MVSSGFVNGRDGDSATWWRTTGAVAVVAETICINRIRSLDDGSTSEHIGDGMHIYLETERLILRRFTEADVDNLVELDSDPPELITIAASQASSSG